MRVWLVVLYTAVIFMAMMVNLAVKPKTGVRMTGRLIVLAAVLGFFFYGYGYANVIGSLPMAVLRATMSVWFMFVGRNDFSSVSSAPLFASPAIQFLFWLAHLLAIYAFASATFITIGAGAVRFMRIMKARYSDITVIYGANAPSVSFIRNLSERKNHGTILVIDQEKETEAFRTDIDEAGGIILNGAEARNAEKAFLKNFRILKGKRHFDFYALHEMPLNNIGFAENLKNSLEEAGVEPGQTSIVIAADETVAGGRFQAAECMYGFGDVYLFPAGETSARALIRLFPPAETVRYGKDGRAAEDFEALLIGFSTTAQSILKRLVINAQMEGAGFHAMVCDRNLREIAGSFFHTNRILLREYDISFMEQDARSMELYDYIEQHAEALKYIVVSTGDARQDQEILLSLDKYIRLLETEAVIVSCSRTEIHYVDKKTMGWVSVDPMTPENLCDREMDVKAKALNQVYCKENGKTEEENWLLCDYFSRESCRAASDFLPGYFRALEDAGIPVTDGSGNISEEIREVLGRTEHRRWSAFHHVMGYEKMPEEIWNKRAEEYRKEIRRSGSASFAVGKDREKKLHACLIPWEDLPTLSEKEAEVTGKYRDYREMDFNNVRIMIEMEKGEDA